MNQRTCPPADPARAKVAEMLAQARAAVGGSEGDADHARRIAENVMADGPTSEALATVALTYAALAVHGAIAAAVRVGLEALEAGHSVTLERGRPRGVGTLEPTGIASGEESPRATYSGRPESERPLASRPGPLGFSRGDWLTAFQLGVIGVAVIWLFLVGALSFGPPPA